jgi:diadenosine tetraphosphate (Ap4A) HIT family hydrolase
MESPFLKIPETEWLAANSLAFAVYDQFPVSVGHALVITRRITRTWFEATPEEQVCLMALVNTVKEILERTLRPPPDGFNVGFNSGDAAGQTVPHIHIHVIPRYRGDVPDPRGGVRYVIPAKANYLAKPRPPVEVASDIKLATGHPGNPLWKAIELRLAGAREIDVVSSFVQLSGLDVVEERLFDSLREGAAARILVGDYLYISDPQALRRLHGWIEVASDEFGSGCLQARLVEMANLPAVPSSFHPKAWRILDDGPRFAHRRRVESPPLGWKRLTGQQFDGAGICFALGYCHAFDFGSCRALQRRRCQRSCCVIATRGD